MKISLASATSLTNLSENTLRRRIAAGQIIRTIENSPNGRSMIPFDAIRDECCIPIHDEDLELIAAADQGGGEAQNDLALLFLSQGHPKNAIYWLELAIKQKHTDAMYWLGRCYTDGNGVLREENIGLMWLARAASEGHVISQEMMRTLKQKIVR